MDELHLWVLIASASLIGSKFLDCWSTVTQLDLPEDELNPFGRAMIKRTGKTVTIWGVFVLTLIIVGVVGGSTYHLVGTLSEGPGSRNIEEIYIWSYILLGLSISLIQGAVAHTNWTGRYNLISTAVAHTYRWVSRIKRFD